MSEFWTFSEIGLRHVLDINGYDHLLFLIALTVPYAFKDWKKILLLVSVFTIGHTLALVLAVFEVLTIKASLIEFLIPLSILLMALKNIVTAGKSSKSDSSFIVFATLFFGLIHGLGFSNYFKAILGGSASGKLVPLIEFAVGIEAGQIIIVLAVLLLSYILQHFAKFSKRDFSLVMSAFVIGVVVPMIITNDIWNK